MIVKDYNFNNNLHMRSKIDDSIFESDLSFDCLNMFEFKCQLEEELGIQIDFDDDNHDYLVMTINEFINTVYKLLEVKGIT